VRKEKHVCTCHNLKVRYMVVCLRGSRCGQNPFSQSSWVHFSDFFPSSIPSASCLAMEDQAKIYKALLLCSGWLIAHNNCQISRAQFHSIQSGVLPFCQENHPFPYSASSGKWCSLPVIAFCRLNRWIF
jgi:hypothetical protein